MRFQHKLISLALVTGAFAVGCGATATPDAVDSGSAEDTSDAGAASDNGTAADNGTVADTATVADTGAASDTATASDTMTGDVPMAADTTATTMYQRLGGHAGIVGFIALAVDNVLKDAELAAYFGVFGGQPGHPTKAQIEECFVDMVGKLTGGPELYPTKTGDGYQCRDMKTAHIGLKSTGKSFDKFVASIAATATAAGVTANDLGAIGAVMNGMKADIVEVP